MNQLTIDHGTVNNGCKNNNNDNDNDNDNDDAGKDTGRLVNKLSINKQEDTIINNSLDQRGAANYGGYKHGSNNKGCDVGDDNKDEGKGCACKWGGMFRQYIKQ